VIDSTSSSSRCNTGGGAGDGAVHDRASESPDLDRFKIASTPQKSLKCRRSRASRAELEVCGAVVKFKGQCQG